KLLVRFPIAYSHRVCKVYNRHLSRHIPIAKGKTTMFRDPRIVLERLCAERGEDFAGLSRMLGRNAAYIQQYVRRGVPKRLKEEERRKLARYFAVSETMLGGPPDAPGRDGLVAVNRTAVRASAGPGAIVSEEFGRPYFAFD